MTDPMLDEADRESGQPGVAESSLSRRMVQLTTNLLATALIVVVGLTMGREVWHWWRQEQPQASANASAGPAAGFSAASDFAGSQLLSLEFGDIPYSFQRHMLSGSQAQAVARLRQLCVEAARTAPRSSGFAAAAERALLARLAAAIPIEVVGDCQIFQELRPVVMVCAVRVVAAEATGIGDKQLIHSGTRRLVSWAVALPRSGASSAHVSWTLLVCTAEDSSASLQTHVSAWLPEGSRPTLLLRTQQGEILAGFRCAGLLDELLGQLEAGLAAAGFRRQADWRTGPRGCGGRFRHADGREVDVQLVRAENESVQGLVALSPQPRGPGAQH